MRDLPWSELPPIPEGKGSPQRQARRSDMWRSVLTQQLQADMLACEMASQLLNVAPDPEAKLYYSTMVQDESRHTEAWLKLINEVGGIAERDPYLDELAHMTLEADTLEEKVFQMQVFYERLIISRFRLIARASRGTVLEELCNRLATDDGIHHGAGMAYERVLLQGAGKKMHQTLVDAANRLLPIFVKHALWRPEGARGDRRGSCTKRDVQRLDEDLEEGVKLAESLGLDVSGVELPQLVVAARSMDGKALAERIRGEIAEEVRELGRASASRRSSSATIPRRTSTSGSSTRRRREAGINAKDIRLASQTTEEELLAQVAELNADDSIDGLLVQLPLPDHIDEARVIRAIDPVKDVDGLHPLNFGQLVPRPAGARGRDAGRRHAPARGVRRPARRRPRGRRRPQRHRRQAGRAAPAARERDRHRLPFADARPRRGNARGRRRSSSPWATRT